MVAHAFNTSKTGGSLFELEARLVCRASARTASKATHRNLVKIERTKKVLIWLCECLGDRRMARDYPGQYRVDLHEDEKQFCLWSLYLVELRVSC